MPAPERERGGRWPASAGIGRCSMHGLPAWEGQPLKLIHPTTRRKMIVEMDQKEGLIRLHNPKGACGS